jgi:hypothetical protein
VASNVSQKRVDSDPSTVNDEILIRDAGALVSGEKDDDYTLRA